MKRIILSLALLAATLGTSAQAAWGTWSVIPHIGAAVSTLSEDLIVFTNGTVNESLTNKNTSGFSGGVDVMYQMTDKLAMTAGIAYSQLGCEYKDYESVSSGKGSIWHDSYTRLDYIEIPLMENIYLSKGFAIKAGIQPRFLVHSKIHTEENEFTIDSQTGKRHGAGRTVMEIKNPPSLRKLDFAIPIGISYEYQSVMLDARYNIGLTNIYKHGLGKAKNRAFIFTIAYKFDW